MTTEAAGDSRARERAIRIDASVLLEAPAGSGKTTVLTQRLLALLAVVDEPEQVLAITFTRKAAAEMRVRVLAALAGDIEPEHPAAELLRTLAARVLARSAARGWHLETQASRLRILTIDAFNSSLAAQRPLAAGAGALPAIADRPDELYLRAARRALRDGEGEPSVRADLDLLFERLDNHWRRVERLIADMLARRAHWLPHVLREGTGDLRARIADSLGRIVADQLGRNVAALPRALLAEAAQLPDVGLLTAEASSQGAWRALAAAALTQAGRLRQRVDARIGPAYRDAANKERLRAVTRGLAGLADGEQLLAATLELPDAELSREDGEALDALARVLTWAARHLQLAFAEAGRVDHVYVAGAARAALSEEGSASDLAIRTGQNLRHILVDEFQDTSIAQFELLETLVQDWTPGDGRTLFLVGDPMQSIYQFREAEVGLFLRARDFGLGPVRFEALRLARNFRSRRALVEFSNRLFTQVFPARDDMRAAAVRFTTSCAADDGADDGAAISMLALAGGSGDAEARAVVERVRALRAADARGSIAVLVLARSHAVSIRAQLAAAGFAVRGVDLVPLADVPAVRDLVALLRALAHPGDRTAWLTVLRAPWCGLTLSSLDALVRRDDPLLVPEALQLPERRAMLVPAERARLERLCTAIAPAVDTFGREAPAVTLESAWLRLGGADCYAPDELEAAHEFFVALADSWSRGEWRGEASLDALLADLFARSAGADPAAIDIMTIHRAKGLEFDHVILPGLARVPRRGEEPLLRWLDLPRAGGASDLVMSPIVAAADRPGHRLGGWIRSLERRRQAQERLRLLYVAATRARKTLHWIAGVRVDEEGEAKLPGESLLAAVWPALGREFAWRTPAAPGAEAPVQAPPSLVRLADSWAPAEVRDAVERRGLPLARESADAPEFSWVRETARHVGTVVHRELERWGREPLPARPAIEGARPRYRAMLGRLGVPEAELDAAADAVVSALSRTREDEKGRWVFAADHQDIQTEWALSGLVDGRLVQVRIDRSFIDAAGTRWVIDFKTSRHEGGALGDFLDSEADRYRPQMTRYVCLARAMGPQPVRAALYFPLIGALRVLEPEHPGVPPEHAGLTRVRR